MFFNFNDKDQQQKSVFKALFIYKCNKFRIFIAIISIIFALVILWRIS